MASLPSPLKEEPRRISYFPGDQPYVCLLNGTSESKNMHSGYVVLSPGEAVGEHSTGSAEELLIPLSGEGEMRIPGYAPFAVSSGCVLYNPPHTTHDVINTGSQPLKYIYVVAGAAKD
jgi:mannose-6-phosphate isomerase-like protein (cupin superfamily)